MENVGLAVEILKLSVLETNASQDEKLHIKGDDNFKLLGKSSLVDSLTLVRLIISVEENILLKTGKQVTVVDESILSNKKNPFANIKSLLKHIDSLIT